MTALICDPPSFSVKYRWPVFQTRQFDSSPSTQTSKNSASRRSRTRTVSSVTDRTRRGGAATLGGRGSTVVARGSTFDVRRSSFVVRRSSFGVRRSRFAGDAGAGVGEGAGGAGSTSGSSSNGRSNRSVIGKIRKLLDVVGAEAQSFDVRGAARLFVGLDDHRIEPRVLGRG